MRAWRRSGCTSSCRRRGGSSRKRRAADFPETPIVLNHTGLPLDPEIQDWRKAMAVLAARPNAAVKISGLGNVQNKREVVLATIDLFGTARAMFASNFPVDSLRA